MGRPTLRHPGLHAFTEAIYVRPATHYQVEPALMDVSFPSRLAQSELFSRCGVSVERRRT